MPSLPPSVLRFEKRIDASLPAVAILAATMLALLLRLPLEQLEQLGGLHRQGLPSADPK